MPTVNIMRDSSKWIMLIPKMWLGCVGIWPEDEEGKLAKLVFWLQFTLSLFISVGQLAYLIVHRYDIMKVISTMITFSAIIQVIIVCTGWYKDFLVFNPTSSFQPLCSRSLSL